MTKLIKMVRVGLKKQKHKKEMRKKRLEKETNRRNRLFTLFKDVEGIAKNKRNFGRNTNISPYAVMKLKKKYSDIEPDTIEKLLKIVVDFYCKE